MVDSPLGLVEALGKAGDGAFVIDHEQRILYWNPAAQQILGYSAEDVVGRNCWETLRGDDDNHRRVCHYRCRVARAAHAGTCISSYDVRVQARDGGSKWINMSILAFPSGKSGDPAIIVHLFRDATLKKQNEEFIREVLQAAGQLREVATKPLPLLALAGRCTAELSGREMEILALLVNGLSTTEIAQSLSITPATTRNHIQTILHKLQAHSRLEAVAYAVDHGLVPRG